MPVSSLHVTAVSLPRESSVANAYASVDYADAYSIALPKEASADPEVLARFIFAQEYWLGDFLMRTRDVLVGWLGLKVAADVTMLDTDSQAARIDFFKVYSKSDTELVMGEDDRHLDFRVSVLCAEAPLSEGGRNVILSTVVHCHNRWGRLYMGVIAPFHRWLVQSSLRRAARAGWPSAA